jgi:glycosyltransferase involved in cell wall biosynthesis
LKVLHVAPAYFPSLAWGGPTESVYALCNHVAQLPGIELRVLTTDTSGPRSCDRLLVTQRTAEQYPGYKISFCRKFAGADFAPMLWLRVWRLVKWADVVHLTSVYSSTTFPTLLATRLLGKPVVWSPRGSLQRWAGSRKRLLKYLWEQACDLLLARERSILHATSHSEAGESNVRIRNAGVVVIPNGVESVPAQIGREWLPRSQMRLLYLGRLDPKKGIENLLDALTLVRDRHFVLRVCGSGDSTYTDSLRTRVDRLHLAGQVTFSGHVTGAQKHAAFFGADVCVVPSYVENFCLVVAEALAHGTPVIASRGTPWSELDSRGAGLWVSNDPATLALAIDRMRTCELQAMGQAGRRWMEAAYAWHALAAQMRHVYESLWTPETSGQAASISQ